MKNFNFNQIFFLLCSFFLLYSCNGQSKPACLLSIEEKISPKINEQNKIGEIINIKDSLSCFEWDSLIVMMAIHLNEKAEKELGLKLPLQYNQIGTHESEAIILFVKGNKVVQCILQKPTLDREAFENSTSIRAYYFLKLLGYNGNDKYYIKIPKEKAVFTTYPMIYHENGKEKTNPKYGLGVKVK
jgi:hypothetical protein